ncbi:hypothetical protein BGZ50_006772 [Haplosporangium sp. Z 11]|nr:hypothetical protein BGZ50_006772 [Haplosporangium sp. Z 11]
MWLIKCCQGLEQLRFACSLGCLVSERLGGVIAGLRFIFLIMVLLSYLYTVAGLDNVYFSASFHVLQSVTAAMVLKTVFKFDEHAFVSNKTKKFNRILLYLPF